MVEDMRRDADTPLGRRRADRPGRWGRLGVMLTLQLGLALAGPRLTAASGLVWRAERDRVDAEVEGLALPDLLAQLARQTGWQILVEPGPDHRATARFRGLETGEALRRLLAPLNFALVPRTNAPATLYVYRTGLEAATVAVAPPLEPRARPPGTSGPLENELIVTLKRGGNASIDELARTLGAKIVGRADGLNSYRLRFDNAGDAAAARTTLAARDDVAAVDSNFAVAPPPTPQLLSAASMPPLSLKPRPGEAGRVVVGLIDTPVQIQGNPVRDFLLDPVRLAGDAAAPSAGELTHGTAMAETIVRGLSATTDAAAGSAVRILPVDVYGANPTTTTFEVAQGIYAAVQKGATIVNLSLASEADSAFLRQLIEQAHRQGVVFIGAAGNEPVATPTFPAAYPEVIAATAGDRSGRLASYANRGSFVDVVAPGSSMVELNQQVYLGSGTSYSAAYVSGVASGLAEKPGTTAAQVEEQLRRSLAPAAKPPP